VRLAVSASRGRDAAKKVDGRKRHIAVDVTGLVLDVVITAASVQDREAARPLLWNLHRACRHVRLVWADAGYTGTLTSWAQVLNMTLQIVAKRDPHTFEVLPRRWVVERTFAWISKHRRTTRDYEHLPGSHEGMILWAMIALMTRRLAQPVHQHDCSAQGPQVTCRPVAHPPCTMGGRLRPRGTQAGIQRSSRE
jgi:putative transposase